MSGTVRKVDRVAWLDGLRGLAAGQVVLQHYIQGFLPALALAYPVPVSEAGPGSILAAPFVFLYDGAGAVCLFFIISGIILTHAFSVGSSTFLSIAVRRAIRLGLPMAAATLVAAALYLAMPDAHLRAGELTGPLMWESVRPDVISLGSIAHHIVFEGLLAGYDGSSLLPAWLVSKLDLSIPARGFDSPLWTLHVEFCGSLLIALLVIVRRSASPAAYYAVCVILCCKFVLSPMILFIIGHLAADRLQTIKVRTWHTVLGTFLVTAGILLCTIRQAYPIEMLLHTYPIEIFLHRLLPPAVGVQIQGAVLQRMTGALMIFGGLVLLPVLQRQLQRRIPSWLGKVSFSLYLLHFPLEFTLFSACFSKLAERLPMGVSVAVTFVIGIAGSLALAVVFERWVDRPSITLSRMADWTRRRRTGGAMALGVKRIPLGDAAD